MKPGQIILLNGTSSAGKTSIARALQEILDEPYLRLGVDEVFAMMPPSYLGTDPPADKAFLIQMPQEGTGEGAVWKIGPYGHQVIHGMHHCVAALSRTGNNVIVDHVFWVPGWMDDAIQVLHDLPVLFVQIYVPLEIAEEREHVRGDRLIGSGRDGYDIVYAPASYDLVLDTSQLGVMECAELIKSALAQPRGKTAFESMYQRVS